MLSVLEQHSGHGIGKDLVKTAEKMLKIRPENNITCTIDVMVSLGPRSRNLVDWYL